MKAIVTGGAGFIGSHLVDRLVADGHAVTVIDPRDPVDPFPKGVKHIKKRVQDVPVRGVGAEYRTSGSVQHPAVVYHLAGPVGPVGVLSQGGSITRDIVDMGVWLQQFTCPVVFVSTSEVYGPQPVLPVAEDANPVIVYGNGARAEYAAAKLATEIMLLNSPRVDVRIIRPFNVAGPRQLPDGGFVLPRFVEQALAGEPLTVYGDGSQVRAFTHVADIVEGIYWAALRGKRNTTYNLGNNANACTIETLAQEVCDALDTDHFIEFVDPVTLHGSGFREAPDKTPETARAYAELDWVPKHSRVDVINDYVAWRLGRG